MGIPVPGETALITASIVASRGRLQIEAVIAVAAVAAILGDNVGFAIGRKLGRRLLTAPGPLLHHRRRVIAVGEPFFDRHGPKAVFLGRWVTGLRITAAWMAGVDAHAVADLPVLERARRHRVGDVDRAARVLRGPQRREVHPHRRARAARSSSSSPGVVLWFVLRVRRRRARGAGRRRDRGRARGRGRGRAR